ncbi:TonB family protein [Hymenobacter sp. 5516J-16]|uniref:energy transducer TonB n=1 Tax=Hymenobacter sp. 5516J-16 TaxID=2932253 RepID=UPI001FD198C3|nr:energy transducer TonB [Hymenobacter sp. 5516J-16]UOQ77317.1 TonB family protein [Hymenobacter sp. 5516J-16]
MRLSTFSLSTVLALTLATAAQAQQPGQTLNDFYHQQPFLSTLGFGPGVQFRADTVRAETGPGAVVKKYFPSGQLYEQFVYANLKKGIMNGQHTRWYENGQVQLNEHYSADELNGELTTYYPTGSLKRRSTYTSGKQLTSSSLTPDGAALPAPELLVFPEYPGGLMALLTTIQHRTNYPRPLIRQGVAGKVQVEFKVDTQGRVQLAHVRKSLHPDLDAEALRVVNSLHGWTPGRLDGELADVWFTLPVTFAIR